MLKVGWQPRQKRPGKSFSPHDPYVKTIIVPCKYVLQDGLWDLYPSLQALMEKLLNLKPNLKPMSIPPPRECGCTGFCSSPPLFPA